MAAEDLENIKRLRPEERIRKLKELEERRKKEIVEAERMIEDSIAEIRKERIIEEVEFPRPEEVDITRHFRAEEKRSALEDVAQREMPEAVEERLGQYATRLEEIKEEMYANPNRAYEFVQEAREQMERLSEISEHYSLRGAAARAFNLATSAYEDIKKYRA